MARSAEERRAWIAPGHPQRSSRRQCALLGLPRGSLSYEAVSASAENLQLMRLLDEPYTATPFDRSRRMTAWLRSRGAAVNHTRGARLRRTMGLEAISPTRQLSQPAAGHAIDPSLLRGVTVNRVNQVWRADLTDVRLAAGVV